MVAEGAALASLADSHYTGGRQALIGVALAVGLSSLVVAILPPPIRTKKPRKQLLAGLAEEQRERLSVAIHFTVGVLLVIGLLALLVTGRLDAPSGPTYPPAGWSCLLAVECEAERPRKQCQSR